MIFTRLPIFFTSTTYDNVYAGNVTDVSIEDEGDNYRVTHSGQAMLFLKCDTLVLPVRNATVEEFSRYLLAKLVALSEGDGLKEIELCVASGPGQKGCATWRAD